MRRSTQRSVGWLAVLALGVAAAAEEPERPPEAVGEGAATSEVAAPGSEGTPAEAAEEGARVDSPLPVYVPPSRGASRMRVGAATRDSGGRFPWLAVLAPDHLGLTTQAQPGLYWYLAETTTTRVDLTLIQDGAVEPSLEITLAPPLAAGFHAFPLAEHGGTLEPGRIYWWFVSLVPDADRRSSDVIAGAAIERVVPDAELAWLLGSGGGDLHAVYASRGLWYDAIDELSKRLSEQPWDRSLRAARAALAEQVGLAELAEFDRAGAALPPGP